MEVRFNILADPIPQARPRFSGRHAYQPARSRAYREVVRQAAQSAMDGREPITGAVDVTVKLFRRFKQTARNFGDLDNHAKSILDACNGICFADDAQVVRLLVEKYTDATDPRAEITITGGD